MNLIVLVSSAPHTNQMSESLQRFSKALGPLPDGVALVAENVWLIDPATAIDFVRLAGQIAEQVGLETRAYSSVPTQPSV